MRYTRFAAVPLLSAWIAAGLCWLQCGGASAQSTNAKPGERLPGPTAEQLEEAKRQLQAVGRYTHKAIKDPPFDREIHTFIFDGAADAGFKEFPVLPFEFAAIIRNGDLTEVGVKRLAANPNLTALYFFNTKVTDAGLKELKALANLTALDVSGMRITPDILNEWKGLKKLDTFSIGKDLTDELLRTLLDNGQLHRLVLAGGKNGRPESVADVTSLSLGSKVTPAGLRLLKRFPALVTLSHNGPSFTDEEVLALKEVGLLHAYSYAFGKHRDRPKSVDVVDRLQIQGPGFTDVGLKELQAYKNLTGINLFGTKVTAAGLAGLKDLASLRAVGLSGGPAVGPWVKDLKQITSLGVSRAMLSDAAVKALREYGRLHLLPQATDLLKRQVGAEAAITHLDLSDSAVTPAGLRELKGLAGLRSLTLHPDQLTDAAVKALRVVGLLFTLGVGDDRLPVASADDVRIINLPGKALTADGLKELKEFKNLRRIGLYRADDEAVRALREMGLLHALTLTRGPDAKWPATPADVVSIALPDITDRGLGELGGFPNLAAVDLRHTQITDEGLKALHKLESLRQVNTEGSRVTADGKRALKAALPMCKVD